MNQPLQTSTNAGLKAERLHNEFMQNMREAPAIAPDGVSEWVSCEAEAAQRREANLEFTNGENYQKMAVYFSSFLNLNSDRWSAARWSPEVKFSAREAGTVCLASAWYRPDWKIAQFPKFQILAACAVHRAWEFW